MSATPDPEAAEAQMIAAERALARGQYREAQQHLAQAERLGTSPHDIERLASAVWAAAERQARRGRRGPWAGFAIAGIGYLLLSVQQPPAWTIPVWAALALGVVPAIAGLATGRWQGPERAPRRRFWDAARAAGGAMFLYSGLSLPAVRHRFSTGAEMGDALLVGVFVTLVYGALAGAVAGLVSALLAGRQGRQE